MDTATRLLQLLELLHARVTWPGEELATRLGVTTRTLRRDIARLRSLDYPVEAVPGPHGGYQLGRGTDLPPLVLEDQEALAVALGLRMATSNVGDGFEDAALSALTKLERVLPERLSEQLQDVRTAMLSVTPGQVIPADPDQLLILAQGCRRRERLRFMYTSAMDVRSLRHVDPFRLVHAARRWYLVAFDLDRDDWRTFRVDRLTAAMATGAPCSPRPDPDAEEMVRAALAVAPYPLQARVRLKVPLERAQEIVPATMGLLEADGDEASLLQVGAWDGAWLARYLASLPCGVEVLEPDEAVTAFRDHLALLVG
jgi:predicted DNA-binding transcriptional regulator YafY